VGFESSSATLVGSGRYSRLTTLAVTGWGTVCKHTEN